MCIRDSQRISSSILASLLRAANSSHAHSDTGSRSGQAHRPAPAQRSGTDDRDLEDDLLEHQG
eukprot:3760650-Alexandrium_andersonii.AAC.1